MSNLLSLVTAHGLSVIDLLLVAGLFIFLVGELIGLPRFRRRLRALGPGEKAPLYLIASLKLWLMAGAILFAWAFEARSFNLLGLTFPEAGWSTWLAWGIAALVSGYFFFQMLAAFLSVQWRQSYRQQLEGSGEGFRFMPDTIGEHAAFCWLGITAGVTEEVIFRGFLIWMFAQIVSLPVAALVALLFFGAFHAYQGAGGLISSLIAGAVLTAMFLLSGSLWPVITLHIAIDLVNAQTSFLAKRDIGLGRLEEARGA